MKTPTDLVSRTPTQYIYPEGVVILTPKFRIGDRVTHALGEKGTIVEFSVGASVSHELVVSPVAALYLVRFDGDTEDTWAAESVLT